MIKTKFSHRVIAVFLTLNFITSIIPVNYVFAGNNGPGSPEAAGFEPVDATDMVSLTNGDLSYVLPLMSVEGFPVNLSYHAGISTDMDASWAGLGWYLNPGAINRSLTNTPDDWKSGVGINFNSFYDVTDYYGVTVDVGLGKAASVGVGLNWGGGKGLSGSVNASLGPFSASVDSDGNTDASVGIGASTSMFGKLSKALGPISGSMNLSYSLKNQWNLSGSVGFKDKKGNSYTGVSYSSSGNFSIRSQSGSNSNGVKGGSVGMSADSFSSGDASVDQQSTGISLRLKIVGIAVTFGFRKCRVKVNIRKGFKNLEWGALYAGNYNYNDNSALIYNVDQTHNKYFTDYAERTRSIDAYSTRLPQSEEQFIGDYSKKIENINFTFLGYDNYNVAAQGVMGNLTPHVFQNATIFDKGQRTVNESGDDIHVFWHHGRSTNSVKRKLGRLSGNNQAYNNNDFYFNFDGQFTSIEKNDVNSINSSYINSANDINDLINEGTHVGASNNYSNTYFGRAKSPNYIEVFTNKQIYNGHAKTRGLISPNNVSDVDRNNPSLFDPDGIGAYMMTAPDGKTYHFSLPVYHYEQIHRGQTNTQENNSFNIYNVNEKRQYSRYATHWLLTAVTGSDYVDRIDPNTGNTNTFNKEDYGYWVELEYGKWSDGFVWRSPYKDRVYEYNTNSTKDIEDKDKGSYSFGRKQIYYLDKINTKNKTALFVKEMRYDAIGKNLKFQYSNSTNYNNGFITYPLGNSQNPYLGNTGDGANSGSLKYTNSNIYVREYMQRPGTTGASNKGVEYKREYSLKLSKIVLVNSEVGKSLPKNSSGNLGSLYQSQGYVPNDTCNPNWESPDFKSVYHPNTSTYTYGIHNENQVLDVNDVSSSFIAQNALKVVELEHSYDLAQNSDSSKNAPSTSENGVKEAKLTLNSVKFKGRGGADYMPATRFDYYLKNMPNLSLDAFSTSSTPNSNAIKSYIEAKAENVDSWGFMQGTYAGENKAKAWSLKEITMPTGAKIEIDYEEDDYWTEAFARRYWHNEFLSFKLYNNSGSDYYTIEIAKDGALDLADDFSFEDYFYEGERTSIDLWVSRIDANFTGILNCIRRRGHINILPENAVNVNVASVNPDLLTLTIPKSEAILTGSHTSKVFNKTFTRCNHPVCQNHKSRGEHADGAGLTCNYDHSVLHYKLLANKVPENETGGGLRVSELKTKDLNKTYKVTYDYNNPFKGNRSSGITSYAPIDGLKFVPYQSEIPAPGVMYEYVTMKEASSTGDYYSKTRYRHHVLKPVQNIFNPNIHLEALSSDAVGEDEIFWAEVTDDYGGLNGSNSRKVEAKKIDIHVNSALIGQIKSIENMNSQGHIMSKTINEYVNGAILTGDRPNGNGSYSSQDTDKGYVKETFNSMKTIFQTNDNGTNIEGEKRLLSVSSKTEYNNMLKKTITIAGGQKASVEYFDVDPWLSSFRKSKTTLYDGTTKIDERVPAYEKYGAMQSKVLDPDNKNMLTQEAMSVTTINNGYQTLKANISSWKDTWTYRDDMGNETIESGVWRKHKTFAWKDNVGSVTGNYSTNVKPSNDYFNWGTGTPTSSKWQNIAEITKYSHWSDPMETRDINNNFASSKMADNFSKVIASGNARYTEMYYSGAEFVASGNTFEGEVKGANYQTDEVAHTGIYSVKTNSANNKVFQVNGQIGSNHNDITKEFRPGKYKVSFWTHQQNGTDTGTQLKLNDQSVTKAETVSAGCWKQFNYYVDLQPNSSFELFVTNSNGGGYYFDDFRFHPVYSSVNSYVYDNVTDQLLYILDPNNMANAFTYDGAGRLKSAHKEVEDTPELSGGFKLLNQYKYHYKDNNYSTNYNEDLNNCIDQTYKPLTLKGLVKTCTPEYNTYDIEHAMYVYNGSGNYKYEWRWLSNLDPETYTNWTQGEEKQFVPYANKYCDEYKFNKVWSVQAKVTDLVTNEVVTANLNTEMGNCDNFITNPKVLLGVEASKCHGDCEDSKYKFHMYPLDQNIGVPLPTSYIDNNSGQTFNLNIYETDGLFCPTIKYVETPNCNTGYIEFVSITPMYEGATGYKYEFYLDCVPNSNLELYPQLKDGSANDPKYASSGTLLIKSSEGKIISVSNINAIKK
jgi:hypothetical protein